MGLPSLVGKNKRSTFNEIKEKFRKKLAGWKEKLLSKAGKEVLIKAVAQAISTYTMSCFKLPDALCEELTSMVRNFWWGQKENEKKIAWLSWEKLCEPKHNGGMGFKKLKQFNLALLAKQGWRLQTNHNSLVYQVLKAKYFTRYDFIEASLRNNPSFSWRSIMAAQKLVREGRRWRVGNGSAIRIWGDKWLPTPSTFKIVSPRQFMHQDTRVSELIDNATASWKSSILDVLFLPHEAEMIKGIPLSSRLPADKLIWAEASDGKFSVKSAYKLALRISDSGEQGASSERNQVKLFWNKLWALPLHHKVRHFAWRACRESLPTKANLMRCRVVQDQVCDECSRDIETTGHALWSCPSAREVWSCTKIVVPRRYERVQTFFDLLWGVMMEERANIDMVAKMVCTAWAIWHNRNVTRHGGKRRHGKELVSWVTQYTEDFKAANICMESTTPGVEVKGTWIPPPSNVYKVNVDAAIFTSQKTVGVGVIIRDDKGRLEAAMSKKINAPLGAVEAEALAHEADWLGQIASILDSIGGSEAEFEEGDALSALGES